MHETLVESLIAYGRDGRVMRAIEENGYVREYSEYMRGWRARMRHAEFNSPVYAPRHGAR